MRMTVQNHIDIFPRKRSGLRRNVHKAKANASAHKIDNERPARIAVAISAHHCHRQPNGAQFIQNPFRANIAEMPNFIRVSRHDQDFLGQTIVCIGQNKDFSHF
jgi:hypothetical protein